MKGILFETAIWSSRGGYYIMFLFSTYTFSILSTIYSILTMIRQTAGHTQAKYS